jgi:hypothetical protein
VKETKATRWITGLVVALIACLAAQTIFGQQDYQKAALAAYANCEATRKLVDGSLKKLDPKLSSGSASEGFKREVADAKEWFKKADDLLAQSKKRMDDKKFDKDLVENLNQAWRWYVEAGTAAVRASMMD